ncbi:unnamed protein product, partial [Chrysoparadoxa australica]
MMLLWLLLPLLMQFTLGFRMVTTKAKGSTPSALRKLVIVESPAKARTIQALLSKQGGNYVVDSCAGHIRDLPANAKQVPAKYKKEKWASIGVNTSSGMFEPLYVTMPGKKTLVDRLKREMKECDEVILATDEDREGEAISWHLVEMLKPKVPVRRAVFHEITPEAIERAFETPREIDHNLVQAQEARRILDRLAGYTMSPLLWKKIAPNLSAGRVQSVGLAIVVKREQERLAFRSGEYWDAVATLLSGKESFDARLAEVDGKAVARAKDFDSSTGELIEGREVLLMDEKACAGVLSELTSQGEWSVQSLEERNQSRKPPPPFITSTLQQECNRKLRLSSKETMSLAQELYEEGFITYMRTDNPSLSELALGVAKQIVKDKYGEDYLDAVPPKAKGKGKAKAKGKGKKHAAPVGAQEAHEAIRPAASGDSFVLPASTGLTGLRLSLYELVFQRTLACVMSDAKLLYTNAGIQAQSPKHTGLFKAAGKQVVFPGFLAAYTDDELGSGGGAAVDDLLPNLTEGAVLECSDAAPAQHRTKPPPRYTEASFVKELEAEGVGRPSTYATILETLKERRYLSPMKGALVPSLTAFVVCRLLQDYFPDFVDTGFTAKMEESLDLIAKGKEEKIEYLRDYYSGEEGLASRVERTSLTIAADDARKARLPALEGLGEGVGVFVGPYGPYVVGLSVAGDKEEDVTAQLPLDMQSDVELCTAEAVMQCLQTKGQGGMKLGQDPDTGDDVLVKIGRYGPYLEQGNVTISLPKEVELLDMSLDQALEFLRGTVLGINPETTQRVSIKLGRFGHYVEEGSKKVPLPREEDPDAVDLNLALNYLQLPKVVAVHPETEKDIKVGIGMYGPYVLYNGSYKKLPADTTVFTITEEAAIAEADAIAKANVVVGEHRGKVIKVVKGRFGHYIKYGRANHKIPKEFSASPETIPLEVAVAVVTGNADDTSAESKAKAPKSKKKKAAPKAKAKAKAKSKAKGKAASSSSK